MKPGFYSSYIHSDEFEDLKPQLDKHHIKYTKVGSQDSFALFFELNTAEQIKLITDLSIPTSCISTYTETRKQYEGII